MASKVWSFLASAEGGDGSKAGFLYCSTDGPWPSGTEDELLKLPEDWIEDTNQGSRVKPSRKKNLPRAIAVGLDGKEMVDGLSGHLLESPFRCFAASR